MAQSLLLCFYDEAGAHCEERRAQHGLQILLPRDLVGRDQVLEAGRSGWAKGGFPLARLTTSHFSLLQQSPSQIPFQIV